MKKGGVDGCRWGNFKGEQEKKGMGMKGTTRQVAKKVRERQEMTRGDKRKKKKEKESHRNRKRTGYSKGGGRPNERREVGEIHCTEERRREKKKGGGGVGRSGKGGRTAR